MAQKRRKNSVLVSFLCPVDLLASITHAIDSQHRHSTAAPLNQSEYIRRAITRDLEHGERARKTRPRRAFRWMQL